MKYVKLWKKAEAYGKRQGLSNEDAEEFASFCIEKVLKNPDCKARLRYLIIDFYRSEYGRSTRGYFEIAKALRFARPIHEMYKLGTEDERPLVDTLFEYADKRARPYLVLRYKWDFTNEDIAEVFGIHPTSVSGKINEAIRDLRKKYMAEREGLEVKANLPESAEDCKLPISKVFPF